MSKAGQARTDYKIRPFVRYTGLDPVSSKTNRRDSDT